ncbi:hypothetical protein Tco_0299975 [Tanacetum coccineum]
MQEHGDRPYRDRCDIAGAGYCLTWDSRVPWGGVVFPCTNGDARRIDGSSSLIRLGYGSRKWHQKEPPRTTETRQTTPHPPKASTSTVIGTDVVKYNQRFQSLALLCVRTVPEEGINLKEGTIEYGHRVDVIKESVPWRKTAENSGSLKSLPKHSE